MALTFPEPTIEFLLRVQDYQGVLHAYHQLMPIIVQSGDQQRLADAYYDMATAYQQTNRTSTAIEHFEKMLKPSLKNDAERTIYRSGKYDVWLQPRRPRIA